MTTPASPKDPKRSTQVAALESFRLAHSTNDFLWFRAKHRQYGNVVVKCCHPNATSATIAPLRWEYYVTRGLEQNHFVVPIDQIHGFESTPFGLIFPEFCLARREFPPRSKTSSAGLKPSAGKGSASKGSTRKAPGSPRLASADGPEPMPAQPESMAINGVVQSTLGDYLCLHGTLDVDQSAQLLRQVILALQLLHDRSIVFRNLSFDTILLEYPESSLETGGVNWDQLRVKLCDFTHASKLPGEVVSHSEVDFVIYGDARFMSPETTGRMNRTIDCRSDFYSLGMVVHGAVTGNTPPANMSMLNMLHYHVAVMPPPLTQHYRGAPALGQNSRHMRRLEQLQQVIDCMVAKLPEKRYQACQDILPDLEVIISGTADDTLSTAPSNSPAATLMDDTQLYGRSHEIEQIRQLQRTVFSTPTGGVLLVSGASGVGKTSLVQELVLPAFNLGGVYTCGKFDQFKRDLPFVPFIQAFTDLINILLLEEPAVLNSLAARINDQLSDNLSILTTLIPNFRHLMAPRNGSVRSEEDQLAMTFTPQAEIVEFADLSLLPSDTLNRMHKTFTSFLEIVSAYKPLTILIDDVQWADWSTSRYILKLISDGLPQHVLLVMTYRSDEIVNHQQLRDLDLLLQSQSQRDVIKLCELRLGNMDANAIAAMLGEICQDRRIAAQTDGTDALVALVYEKTLGNPYYVRRFLQRLHNLGALKQSRNDGTWDWDLEQIGAAVPMDNVVDMLIEQLGTLDKTTRLLLQIASVLGVEFDLLDFAQLLVTSPATVWNAMLPGVSAGYARIIRGSTQPPQDLDIAEPLSFADLHDFASYSNSANERVLPQLDDMHVAQVDTEFVLTASDDVRRQVHRHQRALSMSASSQQSPFEVRYQWEHDRVHQAAYQSIDPALLSLVHLKVGQWKLSKATAFAISNDIFDIVHHLSSGKEHLVDRRDRCNLAKLFMIAVSKARQCIAFDAAINYCREAIALLDDETWDSDYEFAFMVNFALLESAYGTELYGEAKQQIDLLKRRAKVQFHKGIVYEQEIRYRSANSDFVKAMQCTTLALEELGFPLPDNQADIDELMRRARRTPSDVAALAKLNRLSDRLAHAALRVIIISVPVVYFVQPTQLSTYVLKLLDISSTKGNSDHGAFAYVMAGLLFCSRLDDIALGYEYGRLALSVVNPTGASPSKCFTYKAYASHVQLWAEPLPQVWDTFEKTIVLARSSQHTEQLGYGICEYLAYKFFGGVGFPTLRNEYRTLGGELDNVRFPLGVDYRDGIFGVLTHLSKRKMTPVAEFLSSEQQQHMLDSEALIIRFVYWLCRLMLHLLADELDEARAACDQLAPLEEAHIGSLFYAEYRLFKGLLAARQMMDGGDKHKDGALMQELCGAVAAYEVWAKHCRSTYGCRHALLRGCAVWLQGDVGAGLDHLDAAIELAKQYGFQNIEAIANETAGRLWLMAKKRQLATSYMGDAHRAYKVWGAEWKAMQMRHFEQFNNQPFRQEVGPVTETQTLEQTALSGSMVDEVDVEMLCDWTFALASEKNQTALLEQFIRLAMLYTGSREGVMLWTKSDRVEASTVDDMMMAVYSTIDDKATVHTVPNPTDVTLPMMSVANYAIRTQETISESSPVMATFIKGGQVTSQQGSFLFFPVVHHGVCSGLLYLANEFSPKTFLSSKRSSLLKLLSSQLNISFENMRLLEELRSYNESLQEQTITLEEMVSQRTSELEKANDRLSSEVATRKKAELEAVQAASANRAFLHNMSHELRTPLNCIIGMAELLSQTQLLPEQNEILEPIMLSAADLLQIINDILDLSKIESGKLTISRHPFSLRDVVDNSLETIAALSHKKKITTAALYPINTPTALFNDSTRIGQVLRNLLSNAIKFTQEGDITLSVTAEQLSGDKSNQYRFTIKCNDTGIGISAEQMVRLFKAFSQGDHSTTRKFGGTGLGLNISRGFALLLHGDLVCHSVPGQGSCFTFTFLTELADEETSVTSKLPKNLTFILWLPRPIIQRMIEGYLAVNGSRFVTVCSPEALAEYRGSDTAHSNTVAILDEQVVNEYQVDLTSIKLPKILLTDTDKPVVVANSDPLTTFIRHPVRCSRLVDIVTAHFQAPVAPPPTKSPSRRAHYTLKVLLAEDNPVNRSVADRMLSKFGITIDVAEDGQQALDACGRERYDLVFMDVQMPVMDGHEATRAIRKNLPTDHQPLIIALTANAFVEDKIVCLNAGMDDVLTKPLTFASLDAMLLKHFQPTRR
ncbi:hypothetical protein RI367_004469 [Sorochytrium milnesiophthora]